MESKSFVKILRKVIREEVRSAVKEMLGEQTISSKKVINHGMSLHRMAEQQNDPYKIRAKKKTYSKNGMLNDLLNETADSYNPAEFRGAPDYPTMNNQMYTSNDAPSFASMMNSQTPVNTIPTTDVNGQPVDPNALPETLTNALTKDYSALMKAIDKKKGI